MKAFILLCCFAASMVVAEQDGGIFLTQTLPSNLTDNDEKGRIINGMQATPGQFPWQVLVTYTIGSNRFVCGGALISNQWVLTAGHCVYNARDFEVTLGITRLDIAEPTRVTMKIEKALFHPQYNKPSNLNNDVAVIKLIKPVQISQYIKPIPLSKSYQYLQPNQYVWVSGWGRTSDQNTQTSNRLNYVLLTTVSNQECKQHYIPNLISDNVVCCSGKDIKSTCQGDSGGPLIQQINGVWTHVGVVSFVSTLGCAKGYPSGYARTASFLGFICANTNIGC